jgi:hypothetical protein
MSRPPRETAAVPYRPEAPAPRTAAGEVKLRHEEELLGIDGVEGVGLGYRGGREIILAYVRDAATRDRLPDEIEEVPVVAEVTGRIVAG